MKTAVFILLGYITCTLRCEVNKREAEIRTKIARESDTLEPSGNTEEAVSAVQPGHVKTPDATKPPSNLNQPEDVVRTDAVVASDDSEQHVITKDAVELPDDTRQPQNVEITEFPGKGKAYQVSIHELDWRNSTLPVDTEKTDYVETTVDSTLPVVTETIDNSTLPVVTETIDNSTIPVDTETIENSTIPVNTETIDNSTLLVDTETIDNSTLPVVTETIDNSTIPVDTETIDNSTLPVVTETIDDSTLPVNTEQPKNLETSRKVSEDVKITTTTTAAASNTTYTVYANSTSEPATHTTKGQEIRIQAYDSGPAKIKVVDALKILEKSKKKYTLASVALIHRLEWLRSTYNVTELVIDHKVDLHEFDEIPNTEIISNASKLLRTNYEERFTHFKNVLINATSKFGDMIQSKFKTFIGR